ncbi:SHD1 domain-containing protein [Pontiella sp.]|uniref:SHD1 domain-containing protein n=1 Tax=Pontiella sp. TaxID=2837462 RepID=UPI0035670706
MRKLLTTLICTTIAATGMLSAQAAKKNDPDKKEVEKLLKEIGGEHYVERMKIRDFCSMRYEMPDGEDGYWHVLSGQLKEGGYHVIIYNNVPEYLGFYKVDFEPEEYEEGKIMLNSGDADEDGNAYYFDLPIPSKGPAQTVRIDGVPSKFVKNPRLEKKEGGGPALAGGIPAVPKEKSASGEVIDYRDWTINMGGKAVTVNAIFVKVERGKVTIKNAKNGREAEIPGSALSDEDKEYVRRITTK